MSNKRAFVVMGPPSSGTRLMARILMAAGCVDDGPGPDNSDHRAIWLNKKPEADLIVVRRHAPMGRSPAWAADPNILRALQLLGYEVYAIIISRDWHCTFRSLLAAPHVKTMAEAIRTTRTAWRLIFESMPLDMPYEVVSYESLVQRPHQVIASLYERLGLTAVHPLESIFDGNEKYYEQKVPVYGD